MKERLDVILVEPVSYTHLSEDGQWLHELQSHGRRKAPASHADAGNIPDVGR